MNSQVQRIHRVVPATEAESAFTEAGISKGGRWTSPGRRVIYTSSSPAAALLECLAHGLAQRESMALVSARLPEGEVPMTAVAIPDDWRALPYARHIRSIGDAWLIACEALALSLPSAVAPQARTILVNPDHPAFRKILLLQVEVLVLDPRLLADHPSSE